VIGNVDANSLVRKLNKMGKHAELWPEPLNQNPPSGGGGGKKNKNKKKTNNNNPNEPQKPNEHSEQHQAGSSDEASPEENSEKPEQDRDNEKEKPEGSAVTIIQNPMFTPNPPPNLPQQIIQQVGGGPGSGGKKKKKKKKNNNSNNNNNNMNTGSNSAGGEGTESTTQEMPVNAIVSHGFVGGGAGADLDSIGYPGGALPHIPSYVVSYSAAQPSVTFGGSYHHPHGIASPSGTAYNGSCFYPPVVVTTVSSGAGSYYMFSEENANACLVM
jgi:hypothetical protein